MKLMLEGRSLGHLSYCSNIHPGESWAEVDANLRRHVPGIRQALTPDEPFGIGLRLSAAATRELDNAGELAKLREFLEAEHCYVFTLNGFPYGPFHGTRVKEEVYLPDWQDAERLRYTNQLADVLAEILPDGQRGSISTVPGAFKARVNDNAAVASMADHFVDHVAHLVDLERKTGKEIVLALEPEPCCFLETIEETVAFFRDHLHGQRAAARLTKHLSTRVDRSIDCDRETATALLRKHLTLCLDICHAAIEFEDVDSCLAALADADIAIGKLQISAGLRLENVTAASAERLRPFVDATYLHQVVERRGDTLTRHVDLPDAFASLNDSPAPSPRIPPATSSDISSPRPPAATSDVSSPQPPTAVSADSSPLDSSTPTSREWRVHFHVPVFLDDLGDFSSTQFFIREVLARHAREPLSDHLEVETYTWNVLPPRYRDESVDVAIVRELEWVRDALLS